MAGEFEFHDLLKEYVEKEVADWVAKMGDKHPGELRAMTEEHLIHNLTDRAVPVLRGLIDPAIRAAAYDLTTGIRWATLHPKE